MSRAFVFGDAIDTDLLAPGNLMKLPPAELAQNCLKAIAPDFAATVRPGDVVFAGANFGLGSSREQAAVSLRLLGVSAVLATSFARIFYRNAINLGLPAFVFPQVGEVSDGDRISLDPVAGRLENITTGKTYALTPIPPHLMAMIEDGGLIPHLKRRLKGAAA
ncbi:LeuD/DmdB family oxidoreductase small subunit [Caulobacter endophyticus]|nr:3-isopropylmalate dehydratase [Caulobacter endophyticus]